MGRHLLGLFMLFPKQESPYSDRNEQEPNHCAEASASAAVSLSVRDFGRLASDGRLLDMALGVLVGRELNGGV